MEEKEKGSSPKEVADYLNEQKNPENVEDDDDQVEESDATNQEDDEEVEDDSIDPEDQPEAEESEEDDEELDDSAPLTAEDLEGHTIMLTIGGQEEEVTLEELQEGYMKSSDYTRKTSELAETRKNLETEREKVKGLQGLQQQYVEQLAVIEQALSQPFSDDQLAKIKEEDGFEAYMEAKDQNDGFAKKMNAIKAEKEKTIGQMTEEQSREQVTKLEHEKSQLASAAPELAKKEGAAKLSKYLLGLGFSDEQIKHTADHRLLVIADKARKYDELLKKGKGKPKPKKHKVFKRKASQDNKVVVQSKQLREVKDRAVKSGSPRDIANYQLAKRKTKR